VDDPVTIIHALAAVHLRLEPEDRDLLLWRTAGTPVSELAARHFRSPRTIRARLDRIHDLIAEAADHPGRNAWLTAAWAALHCDCPEGCLGPGPASP
jgi:DNA-binding CsgD family transcriptional regulator